VVGMKKKESSLVGVFSIDESGNGRIDIVPLQETALPFRDGEEVTIVVEKTNNFCCRL
jgi:hypothetical protein